MTYVADVEDLLYEIYNAGVYDEVLELTSKLTETDKYRHTEFSTRLKVAYEKVVANNGKQ